MRASLTRRLTAALVAAGAATATALVAAPVPAPAGPGLSAGPGLIRVDVISNINSSTGKSVTADCPAGTTVVGGGGYAGNLSGQVFVTGLEPVVTNSGSGYRVTATEDETGYSGNWYVVAIAHCARAPRGLEYRSASTRPSSSSSQGVSVTCSTGAKKVLATGAVIDGGGREVGLSHVLPTPASLTHVAAVAHEDETGYQGTWSVTAWAICADPFPVHEWVIGFPSTFPTAANVSCPAGTQVYGAGGYLDGGWGQVRIVGAFPDSKISATLVAQADETGYAGTWQPVVAAICAG